MASKPEYTENYLSESDGNKSTGQSSSPQDDGRNKEWQDRARVNLEEVPEGTKTNLERDFEPERLDEGKSRDEDKTPAY